MKQNRLLPDLIKAWKHYSRSTFISGEVVSNHDKFIRFIKQPLALGMFIPCKDGKPLDKPIEYDEYAKKGLKVSEHTAERLIHVEQYQKAEARVIFEGFTECYYYTGGKFITFFDTWIYFDKDGCVVSESEHKSIHDLANKVTLAEAKFKELGL